MYLQIMLVIFVCVENYKGATPKIFGTVYTNFQVIEIYNNVNYRPLNFRIYRRVYALWAYRSGRAG
jgi:hypothetical protein